MHFHLLSQFRSWQVPNLWQVQRGKYPAFLSPDLQLSYAFAYCHVKNISRDLPLKRRTLTKYRPRSELAAELGPCTQPCSWTPAGPLRSVSCKRTCSEQHYHSLRTGMVICVTSEVPFLLSAATQVPHLTVMRNMSRKVFVGLANPQKP